MDFPRLLVVMKKKILSAVILCASACTGVEIPPMAETAPLRNPDRGYHLESNLFVHDYRNPFHVSETYPEIFIDEKLRQFDAQEDSLTLTQLYLYLSEYVDGNLPEEALDRMQVVFDDLKAHGYKAILRFAYNYKGIGFSGGETEEMIGNHLEQLRPFILKNLGQIATCQMGFIGAWGEWHSSPLSTNQDAKNMLVNRLLDIFPEEYCLEMRYPAQKRLVTLDDPDDWKRIGFSNDYFTAGEHPLAPDNDFVPGDENYEMVFNDSPYFFMSGEIPYAENTEWGLHKLISVDRTLQILRDHHYSAFDITQNNELNIKHWKSYPVYPARLDSLEILYDMSYFKENGRPVSRSAYDFIRDHLGYRLNMTGSAFRKTDKGLACNVEFTNTGFAAVMNPHHVYFVILDKNDDIVSVCEAENADPKLWQPYDPVTGVREPLLHGIHCVMPLDDVSKGCKVGIWMPDANLVDAGLPAYDIKWVENGKLRHLYKDGKVINVIGEIR